MFNLFKKRPDYFHAAYETQQEWLEYAEHATPVLTETKHLSEKEQLFAGFLLSNFHMGFLISGVVNRTGTDGGETEVHAAVRMIIGDDIYYHTQSASAPSKLDSSYPTEDIMEHLEAASIFMDFFTMGLDERNLSDRNECLLADAMSHVLNERLTAA